MPDFKLLLKDEKSRARLGELKLKHGSLKTPSFMPVGTYGAVRALSSWDLQQTGAQIMLSNTYHLVSRPGVELIEKLGGLHRFNNWNKPILTDSGGFQVFSLAKNRKLSDEGVSFRDPFDGREIFFSPENVIEFQQKFGSDVMMVLDECPPSNAEKSHIEKAVERTTQWAGRALENYTEKDLALFCICQGACDLELRKKSLSDLLQLESKKKWSGIAIGGLSVGESKKDFVKTLYGLRSSLPDERPHYLMGVGTPRDLVFGVACGIDMFDCVIPSRNARHGIVMTREGRINLFNNQYRDDPRPLDENSSCPVSSGYSRAFLRHLFVIGEHLGPRLATMHNVAYFIDLMKTIREKIEQGEFLDFALDFLSNPKTAYLGKEQNFSEYPNSFR